MSSTDSDSPSDNNPEETSVLDKAKQAASDIDVQAMMGRAKEVAGDVKDRSVTVASSATEKVRGFVGTNEEKIDGAIDRTGQFVDEKLTRQKFSDKIGKVSDVAKGAVTKVGQAESNDDSDIVDAEIVDEVDEEEEPPRPAQDPTTDEN